MSLSDFHRSFPLDMLIYGDGEGRGIWRSGGRDKHLILSWMFSAFFFLDGIGDDV